MATVWRGPAERPVGYTRLLWKNGEYRKLWLAQVVSNLGDWFNNIAVLALVWGLTGSGLATGLVIAASQLPMVLLTPISGVVLDRLNRKKVMVAADLIRAVLALGFLLIRTPGDIWMAYFFSAALIAVSAFFQPAVNAIIPQITTRRELIAANGLSNATFGLMMAVGAALGGVVSGWLGPQAAFVINSLSYLMSAGLVWSLMGTLSAQRPLGHRTTSSDVWREFLEGLRYARRRPEVLAMLVVKMGWSLGGGVIVLLTVFAEKVFRAGNSGIGWLYTARGLGIILGPALIRSWVGNDFGRIRRTIPLAYLLSGLFYLAFSQAPSLWVAFAVVMLAHFGGGITWTLSSTVLQQIVPNELRGRLFSVDNTLVVTTSALSTLLVGWLAEMLSPRLAAALAALVFLGYTVLWAGAVAWSRRHHPEAWDEAEVETVEHTLSAPQRVPGP